jgi:two-component sensor histidine kinase
VATELASNAFEHGRGAMAVTLGIDERGLRISVQDDSESGPAMTANGYGLRIVDQLSTSWGVIRRSPGKSVWTRLDLFVEPG